MREGAKEPDIEMIAIRLLQRRETPYFRAVSHWKLPLHTSRAVVLCLLVLVVEKIFCCGTATANTSGTRQLALSLEIWLEALGIFYFRRHRWLKTQLSIECAFIWLALKTISMLVFNISMHKHRAMDEEPLEPHCATLLMVDLCAIDAVIVKLVIFVGWYTSLGFNCKRVSESTIALLFDSKSIHSIEVHFCCHTAFPL